MKKNLFHLLILFFSAQSMFGSGIKSDTEEVISDYFDEAEFVMQKIEIPLQIKTEIEREIQQKFFDNFLYVWKIFRGDSLNAIAILDNVYGKALPITFLTAFNLEGEIIFTEIIKYREQYGGGVKDGGWLNQFKDKNSRSNYEVGKDIQGISGATISVNSITKGIRKSAAFFEKMKDELLAL